MIDYGMVTTTTTAGDTVTDDLQCYRDRMPTMRYRRISVRVNVHNQREETKQYLIFSALIDKMREEKTLVTRDIFEDYDMPSRPRFKVLYSNKDSDGRYQVLYSYTELVM